MGRLFEQKKDEKYQNLSETISNVSLAKILLATAIFLTHLKY